MNSLKNLIFAAPFLFCFGCASTNLAVEENISTKSVERHVVSEDDFFPSGIHLDDDVELKQKYYDQIERWIAIDHDLSVIISDKYVTPQNETTFSCYGDAFIDPNRLGGIEIDHECAHAYDFQGRRLEKSKFFKIYLGKDINLEKTVRRSSTLKHLYRRMLSQTNFFVPSHVAQSMSKVKDRLDKLADQDGSKFFRRMWIKETIGLLEIAGMSHLYQSPLKLFDESEYDPSVQARTGHPYSNASELFASATVVLLQYKSEFMRRADALPPEQKDLVLRTADKIIKLYPPGFFDKKQLSR